MIPGLSRIGLDPLATHPLGLWPELSLSSVLGGDAAAWELDSILRASLASVLGGDAAAWQLSQEVMASLATVLGGDAAAWALTPETTAALATVLGGDGSVWSAGAVGPGQLVLTLSQPDGAPLAGVVVTVTPWQAFGSSAAVVPLLAQELLTDAEGVAALTLPQTGGRYRYRLTADRDGLRVLDVELRLPADTGLAQANARGQRWH